MGNKISLDNSQVYKAIMRSITIMKQYQNLQENAGRKHESESSQSARQNSNISKFQFYLQHKSKIVYFKSFDLHCRSRGDDDPNSNMPIHQNKHKLVRVELLRKTN